MYLKYIVLKVSSFVCIGIVYFVVISDAWRNLIPRSGVLLSELPIPFSYLLDEYSGFCDLDLANVFALIAYVCVYKVWDEVLKIALFDDDYSLEMDDEMYRNIVKIVGGILIFGEFFLFYEGIKSSQLWGSGFSFAYFITALVYMCVVCCCCLFCLLLQRGLDHE